LKTERSRAGYFIAASAHPKLASLCEKYGIAPDEPADVNSVNSVNSTGDGQAEEMA
jgi:hypothetical protein